MTIKLPQLVREHPFAGAYIPEPMIWTSSAIKQFRRCKRKFFWKYIMRLRPRGMQKALEIGSAFHNAIGEWYKCEEDIEDIVERYAQMLEKTALENKDIMSQSDFEDAMSEIQTFTGMMLGYTDVHASDLDEWDINPDFIEVEFEVDMGDFIYAGQIDGAVFRKNKCILLEHKTASKIDTSYIERLPMDTQIRGYLFGAIHGLGLKPKEVLYDVVRKCNLRRKSNETHEDYNYRIANDYMARPEFYFYREALRFSSSDLRAFEYEIRQTHAEFLHVIDSCDDPLDPRSWGIDDQECRAFFRTCPYLPLCTTGLDRGNAIMFDQIDGMHNELTVE